MIDYIALVVGHALLGLAFWRLFMRASVDVDPLLDELNESERANRKQTSSAARNAARRGGPSPNA